jgi:hypothetical protein
MKANTQFGYRGDRVRENTAGAANRAIDSEMQHRVQFYSDHPDQIDARIGALNTEWDMERVLEMNASSLAFLGVVLGATVHRRWLLLPGIVLPFLFQHAIQGWCPPIPLLRRIGVRTQREIEAEKYALKSLQKELAS